MPPHTEVRGVFYKMIADIFPHIGEIVGPELGKHFEDVDATAWYDAGPYLETRAFLAARISPDVMSLLGEQLVEIIREGVVKAGVREPLELGRRLPEVYGGLVRGEGAGTWEMEEGTAGRAIIRESGITSNVDFGAGILKGGLEGVGAYNIRVTVLDNRADGAPSNRYLVEWMEPNAGGR